MPASSNLTGMRGDFSAHLRVESGAYLRDARRAAGLTQAALAKMVGITFPTFISQLELGRGFVSPDRYVEFANALNIPLEEFVREQIRFTNPWAHAILFGNEASLRRLKGEDTERRLNQGR